MLSFAVLCLLAAPAWELLRAPAPAIASLPETMFARSPAGWQAAPGSWDDWHPIYQGADRVERVEYTNDAGVRVQLFVASYATQALGKEMVNYGNTVTGPKDGNVVLESTAATPGVGREIELQADRGRSVIRYYYDVDGRRLNRGIAAQLWYGVSSIRREPRSSIVALRASCAADCNAARKLLGEFAASLDASRKNPT